MRWILIAWLLAFVLSRSALADPVAPETIRDARSDCVVETSGGEYPRYVAKKRGKVIFAPRSDGITKVLFSPSAEYLAFFGSEIDWVDVGDKAFAVVVMRCPTGELRGFAKGFPGVKAGWVDDMTIKFHDNATKKDIVVKIVPDGQFSFRLVEILLRDD